MQLLVAGPQSHTGELPQPRPERLLRGPAAPVAERTMDRSTPTARQARRSDTWYASRAQCTRARRAAGLTIFF
jgi:hypothetical protein